MKIVDTEGHEHITRAVTTKTATIALNASLSGEIDLEGCALLGIIMPAAWTAAVLSFQAASAAGGTYADVYDDSGAEVTSQAAASRAIGLDAIAGALAPFRFVKIRSGTTAAAVNQEAARTLTLVLKG